MEFLPLVFLGLYTQAPPPGHVHVGQGCIQQEIWNSWILRGGSHDPAQPCMRDVNSRSLTFKDGCCCASVTVYNSLVQQHGILHPHGCWLCDCPHPVDGEGVGVTWGHQHIKQPGLEREALASQELHSISPRKGPEINSVSLLLQTQMRAVGGS